ncbi:hypothetical protein HDU98_008248, partial [Podochytrium sp. JEL0797]
MTDQTFFTPSLATLGSFSDFAVGDDGGIEGSKGAVKAGRRKSTSEGEQKPKRGRKLAPLPEEPVHKRLAQNRIAQRAFRERKVNHLKDLETRVAELTHIVESNASLKEMAALKDRLSDMAAQQDRLLEENEKLRQMAFSFDASQLMLSPNEMLLPSQVSPIQTASSASNLALPQSSDVDFANMLMNSITSTNALAPFTLPVMPNPTLSVAPPAPTDPTVLDYMSLLNFDAFKDSPSASSGTPQASSAIHQTCLFDDADLESVLLATPAPTAPNAPQTKLSSSRTPSSSSSNSDTDDVHCRTSMKTCMLKKAAKYPDSMTPQFSCVSKALQSVPTLQDKSDLVNELCNMFVEFTTKCDSTVAPITLPVQLSLLKQRVLMEAEGCSGDVEGIFEEVKVQHMQHLERRVL